MAQRSLFGILTEQHWAVSLLVAALIYGAGSLFSPLIGAAAALPFIGIAGYMIWLRLRRGPKVDAYALMKALRGATPDEVRAMLAERYARERFEIADGALGDLELQKNGYVTLVRYRRWRAQSTGPAAVDELHAAMRTRNADHGVYVTAGGITEPARKRASAIGITLVDGAAMAELIGRTRAARQTIQRVEREAAAA